MRLTDLNARLIVGLIVNDEPAIDAVVFDCPDGHAHRHTLPFSPLLDGSDVYADLVEKHNGFFAMKRESGETLDNLTLSPAVKHPDGCFFSVRDGQIEPGA